MPSYKSVSGLTCVFLGFRNFSLDPLLLHFGGVILKNLFLVVVYDIKGVFLQNFKMVALGVRAVR